MTKVVRFHSSTTGTGRPTSKEFYEQVLREREETARRIEEARRRAEEERKRAESEGE